LGLASTIGLLGSFIRAAARCGTLTLILIVINRAMLPRPEAFD
jgi:hypothetical protein